MCTLLILIASLIASGLATIVNAFSRSLRKDKCLNRWRVGHQVFSSLDQMLVLEVSRLSEALSRKDWPLVTELLYRTSRLLVVSSVVLKYTGSFGSSRDYSTIVVPSMQSYAPGRMSGLNMPDHQALVQSIRGLEMNEEVRCAWPTHTQTAYGVFASALATAIDHHRYACKVMAGRRAPISNPGGRSTADEILARINAKRKRDAGCPRRR
jgi:hypothetical protein